MQEKIKIISDGKIAKIYIDGKKVGCTNIDFVFRGRLNETPMISCEATFYKQKEDGSYVIDDTNEIVKETVKIGCDLNEL